MAWSEEREKEEAIDDVASKDEREASSVWPTLELFCFKGSAGKTLSDRVEHILAFPST